jgi:hypothetical protein
VSLPWPDVGECYGHRNPDDGCQQCDGSHEHRWVEGPANYGVPVRCSICGGRKCDVDDCWERRHHQGPHISVVDGSVREVGK